MTDPGEGVCSVVEPPWKAPGVDLSDYFNYGLTPETWKLYCKQVEQYRLEYMVQQKVETFESDSKLEVGPSTVPPVVFI